MLFLIKNFNTFFYFNSRNLSLIKIFLLAILREYSLDDLKTCGPSPILSSFLHCHSEFLKKFSCAVDVNNFWLKS